MGSAALLVLSSVFGCSDGSTSLGDLKKPALVWTSYRGNCGAALAVDGEGGLWKAPVSCESGEIKFSTQGLASADGIAALRSFFELLPVSSGADRSTCSGALDVFERRSDDDAFKSQTCASGQEFDTAGLTEPYSSVAQSFLSLP